MINSELHNESEAPVSESGIKKTKTLSTGKIFVVNCVLCALFLLAALFSTTVKPLLENPVTDISNAHDVIDNEWAFFLITPNNPLPVDYSPQLAGFSESFLLDRRCAEYALAMMAAAEKDGITLCVASAYRSVQKQQENLEQYIQRLIDSGHSKDEATKIAALEIAPPGASEHNAGLAVDFLTADWWDSHSDVTADFDATPEYRWLAENSWKYGFILRYGKDDTEITGYAYEPWHYRFVGVYHAKKIYDMKLTLEEYMKLK